MVTGGGVSHLNESLATIGVPGMTQTTFTNIEHISDWWCGMLDEELQAAVGEEKRLVIARGDLHGGVPAITAVCDGAGPSALASTVIMLLVGWLVCWSLTSLCHSNGHIETMPAREINPFTALTRIRSQFLRTQ